MLEFCAEHHILPEVEMIKMQDINDAFDKMNDKEVCFRYVIYWFPQKTHNNNSLGEPATSCCCDRAG